MEFLLARSQERGRSKLLTLGALGSHHCLATAAFGNQLGFEVDLYLYPQPLYSHVLDNLRLDFAFGANMFRIAHITLTPFKVALGALRRGVWQGEQEIIPPGGSDPVGSLGYVEGAIELAEQIEAGDLPRPAIIFVPAGTCGTAAGLIQGLALAGLSDIKVVAVQVVESIVCNQLILGGLVRRIGKLLKRQHLKNPPAPVDYQLLRGFLGRGYGHITESALNAQRLMAENEGLNFELTYTSKALAGTLDWLKGNGERNKNYLYWNTVNGVDMTQQLAKVTPEQLPKEFWPDFKAVADYQI